jgi:diguanylate cyclase
MIGIRTRLEQTEDIEALKHTIQEGLDAIENHFADYLRREEELTREAEQRIADLSSRLHDIKYEAFTLQKQMQEQRDRAMKDPLTSVFNRLAFEEHMQREFIRWKRYGDPLSICIIDIDHFKTINDTCGHLAGDKALKAMSVRLLQNVREVDIVCRYGGEEFVVIMPNTAAGPAYHVAEKLRNMINATGFHYNHQPIDITVSCGVASFQQGDDPQSVFQRADDALYTAKKSGRNRTCSEQLEDSHTTISQV